MDQEHVAEPVVVPDEHAKTQIYMSKFILDQLIFEMTMFRAKVDPENRDHIEINSKERDRYLAILSKHDKLSERITESPHLYTGVIEEIMTLDTMVKIMRRKLSEPVEIESPSAKSEKPKKSKSKKREKPITVEEEDEYSF